MQEEEFDSFYRGTRDDLLLQAFVLTGDLTAATGAVRDAYVIAWHHWAKVGRQADPLDYVRPMAWRLAQRRSTGRIWHRNKGISAQDKAVLEGVSKVLTPHRRVLLLVDLVGLPLDRAARELALTMERAEHKLATARQTLSTQLQVSEADLPAALEGLRGASAGAVLPRPPIVLRAGRKRRRVHTVTAITIGAVLTVAAGAVAREPGLDRASGLHRVLPGGRVFGRHVPEVAVETTANDLLGSMQVVRLAPQQSWRVTRTDNNTTGDGLNTICQRTRFADPKGLASLVRAFAADGTPGHSALQTVEISRTPGQAKRAYATTIGWFAGCQEARVQLLDAYRVDGVGDQADVLVVRDWGKPVTTYSIAVARNQEVTTTLAVTTVDGEEPGVDRVVSTLAESVTLLCPEDSQPCVGRSSWTAVPPPPSGEERGLLAVVDLPPVGALTDPWVGTEAAAAKDNPAATTCDLADFAKAGAAKPRTRTFLIPFANVPARFGLAQTYGRFGSAAAAKGFLAQVRSRFDGCEDRDLATTVTSSARTASKDRNEDTSVWTLETDVTEDFSVKFRVAFVRVGDKVTQLTFAPGDKDDMTDEQFRRLASRAGERLRELA